MLFRRRSAAVKLIGKHVLSKKGLVGLSRDSLRFSQPQILRTLEVMTDPDSYPVLVHCTQGKDRTGLIAILVCLVTEDVPVDAIKEDYVLSQEGLLLMREQLIPEMAEVGMKLDYLDAPEKLVYEVHRILDEEYGGVEAYLDMIGFDGKRRERLREILKR
jgi:protein-tyrosine phosphatase